MSNGLDRRRNLFNRFADQLLLLKEKGLIAVNFQFDRPYICPICLREFSEADLAENPKRNFLTLEDAPPASLRGSKVALTCKECNSNCGRTIDFHLTEIIREIDASYFYKGSVHHRNIDHNGKLISVELTSMGDGTLQAYHRIKNNNPTLLDKFIYSIKEKTIGPALNLMPPRSRVDSKRVNYALVKANYIITFSKFGYIFLLNPAYDNIRAQLLQPDQIRYPWTPFIKDQFASEHTGTYYIHNPGVRSIMNVFSLRTEYSETIIAGSLPLPHITTPDYGARIDQLKDAQNHIVLDTTRYDPQANIFNNWNEIKKISNWINKAS